MEGYEQFCHFPMRPLYAVPVRALLFLFLDIDPTAALRWKHLVSCIAHPTVRCKVHAAVLSLQPCYPPPPNPIVAMPHE